jgi:hypothetical protein
MKHVSKSRPGVREQHLLRKMDNPLFGEVRNRVGKDDLAQARLEDGIERDRFLLAFQSLIQRAVDLPANAPSEAVLELKEELDRSYQQACALPGDMTSIKQSITRLIDITMQAIRAGAGSDAHAQQQLIEEDIARRAHFELQEIPLVAALMHPDSPVGGDELIPALLSETPDSLAAALTLFDDQQLATVCHDAGALLAQLDPERRLADAWARLQLIEDHYRQLQPATPAN